MKYLIALACLFAVGVLATPAQAGVGVNVGVGVPLYAPAPVYAPPPAYYPAPAYYAPAPLRTRLRLPAFMWRRRSTSGRGSTVATATGMATVTADAGTAKSKNPRQKKDPGTAPNCSGVFSCALREIAPSTVAGAVSDSRITSRPHQVKWNMA